MVDEAAEARLRRRVEPSMSDGGIEYIAAAVYGWVDFVLSCFGHSFAAADESTLSVRKLRIMESVAFVVVLSLFLSVSIFAF